MRAESAHFHRLRRLRRKLKDQKLDALAVVYLPNVRYLTGFTGSSGALYVDGQTSVFITDFRYRTQAAQQVQASRRREHTSGLAGAVAEEARRRKVRRLGFEPRHTTWAFHRALRRGSGGAKLVPADGVVEELRMVKDRGEIQTVRKAIAAAGGAFTEAGLRSAGRRERDVATAMERIMVDRGAEHAAFPTIVASGPRGALPHAVPGRGTLRPGQLTVIDFGATAGGYNSDTTRTIIAGKVPKRAREIYRIVRDAQTAAIEAVRPGVRAADIDRAARQIIEQAGYGEFFGHGTGHGVGLEVHEPPTISPRSGEIVASGMVFTVEPGIYLENFGGVRIEDMVLVTRDGCTVLTKKIPKQDL